MRSNPNPLGASPKVEAAILAAAVFFGGLWLVASRTQSPWHEAASVAEVQNAGVVYDSDDRVFLVEDSGEILALSALSPHRVTPDERVLYCERSGLFEGFHGEKFDRLGSYFGGPAPNGLDTVAIKIENGSVFVDPKRVTRGSARGEPPSEEPTGPFCAPNELHEAEPGFAQEE
jgi:nitrite reductase/ring-hydroxylating ferredoxin subunit